MLNSTRYKVISHEESTTEVLKPFPTLHCDGKVNSASENDKTSLNSNRAGLGGADLSQEAGRTGCIALILPGT